MNDDIVIPFFVAGTMMFVVFAFFLIIFLVTYKNKQNKHAIEKSRMIFDHENRLLRTRVEEQERTMNTISMEIHDNVNQILNFARMNLHVITRLSSDIKQRDLLNDTGQMLDDLIQDVHNISHSLNGQYVKGRGFLDALSNEMERLNGSNKIQASLQITGNTRNCSPEKELMIFRVVQEALTNVLKHARATEVQTNVAFTDTDVDIIISDNGIGFETQSLQQLEGIGMINMYQRAKVIGGKLSIDSAKDHGTKIGLSVPI